MLNKIGTTACKLASTYMVHTIIRLGTTRHRTENVKWKYVRSRVRALVLVKKIPAPLGFTPNLISKVHFTLTCVVSCPSRCSVNDQTAL